MNIDTNPKKTNPENSKGTFHFFIKDCQWFCITVLVIVFLLLFGNNILKGLYQSGIQKLTLAGNSIEFKTQEGYSYILALPANQYWLSSDIRVNTGSHYVITVSGMVSTGMGKNSKLLPKENDYDFSNRNFQGMLEYPDLANLVTSTNSCTQALSDSIKIKYKIPYGALLVGAFTEDEINHVRQNPWKFSDRIISVSQAQRFSVHYTSKEPRWDLSEDKPKLYVNRGKFVLYFIVNDSVIPDLDPNAPSQTQALYAFAEENNKRIPDISKAMNIQAICDITTISETHQFFEPSLRFAAQVENASNSRGYGPRALWFLDNKGVFTIVVDNKDN